jgi:hypothetical protein
MLPAIYRVAGILSFFIRAMLKAKPVARFGRAIVVAE